MYQSHPRTAPNADAGDGCLFLSRPASLPAALVLPSCSYMSTFQRTLSLGQRKGPSLPKASAKVQPICNTSQIFQRLFSKFFYKKTQTRWKTAPYTETATAAFETAPCKTAAHKTEKERKRKERTDNGSAAYHKRRFNIAYFRRHENPAAINGHAACLPMRKCYLSSINQLSRHGGNRFLSEPAYSHRILSKFASHTA